MGTRELTTKRTTTPRRRKMGRPAAPLHLQRRNRIVTFITDEEQAQLERLAVRDRLTLSAAVYRILHGSLQRKREMHARKRGAHSR